MNERKVLSHGSACLPALRFNLLDLSIGRQTILFRNKVGSRGSVRCNRLPRARRR
jgi:hypothetical protein